MFLTLVTIGLLASCSADISHLGLSSGYLYDSPQYNLNIPVHAPQQKHIVHAVSQVTQNYLPPTQQNYAPIVSIPRPNYEPQAPIYNQVTVNQEYLPPQIVSETVQEQQPVVQIPQYVQKQEHFTPVQLTHFVSQQAVHPQYQAQAPAPIYETQEAQTADFAHNQQSISASLTGGYHYDSPNKRFR